MAIPTYQKTELGRQVLKDRSPELTSKQRSAFILFDGTRSTLEVLNATSGLGMTPDDVDMMVQRGFLAPVVKPAGTGGPRAASSLSEVPASSTPAGLVFGVSGLTEDQDRYQSAYLMATELTSSLGLRGFRLNLAVEAAGNLQQLRALAPKIREALGPDKVRLFEQTLGL